MVPTSVLFLLVALDCVGDSEGDDDGSNPSFQSSLTCEWWRLEDVVPVFDYRIGRLLAYHPVMKCRAACCAF